MSEHVTETTNLATAAQLWAAEKILATGSVVTDASTLRIDTDIDLDGQEHGYGYETYPAPRAELVISSWTDLEVSMTVQLDEQFDIEDFVEDCLAARDRARRHAAAGRPTGR